MKERQRATRKDNRGRILRKGEGQDKNGRYYFIYTDNQGKRKRIYDTDLIELRQAEKDLQKDLEDGINLDAAKRTLNEQFEIYLATKNIRDTTLAEYRIRWRAHIGRVLGDKRLTDIKKTDIQLFYKQLSDAGLKNSTIHTHSALLVPTLESAVNDDIIRRNPAKDCLKEYNSDVSPKKALTLEQQENLLNYVDNTPKYAHYKPFIMFALATACRKGEILGLRWEDVDLKNRTISINHQLQYSKINKKYGFVLNKPKTQAGQREIPMTQKCYQALIRQREYQLMLGIDHDLEVCGIKNFVFTTTRSTPYAPQVINTFLRNIVNAYNKAERKQAAAEKRECKLLPHISSHTLRHTACTRLAESNIDVKVLQQFMGHSDIRITMNVYNHVDNVRMRTEIEKAEKNSMAI